VIQQNAGASEEMASTAEELASQAEQLQGTIAFFRIGSTAPPALRRQVRKQAQPASYQKLSRAGTAGKAVSGLDINMCDTGSLLEVGFEKY